MQTRFGSICYYFHSKEKANLKISFPTYQELRNSTARLPNSSITQWDSYNTITEVKARSPDSTFVVKSGNPSSLPEIDRNTFEHFSKIQDAYIEDSGFYHIKGSIGNSPDVKAEVSLHIEKNSPNIAAMQKQLLFPYDKNVEADFKVIYTPNLSAAGFPNNRCILVDLENYTTRIAGTDYFGESKKAGLRMWNKWVYDKGGLALHAGCKTYRDLNGRTHSILIIGLSGTGKTTTTFTPHLDSEPVQDDFCAFFPDGQIYASENGCFAKTYGLNAKDEPIIYHGITHSEAWLENTFVKENGEVDFYNDAHTSNGRGTFSMDLISHGDLENIPPLSKIIFLNRNFDIIPAIAKLNHAQAAAFFMLGETTGTSAGGITEADKALRIPGTNPFFPLDHTLQANRFLSLLDHSPEVDVYLMNTGYIGGYFDNKHARKVTIHHSQIIIEAMLNNKLHWITDPDFGYDLVSQESSPLDSIYLHPKQHYINTNRLSQYENILRKLNAGRVHFLNQYKYLDSRIMKGLDK